MKTLVPCTGCQRHVRADETACPFCGVAVDASLARPEGVNGAGLSRAAVIALGAALAAACSQPAAPNEPGAPPAGPPATTMGKPSPPAPTTTGTSPKDDPGSMVSMYGMATVTPRPPPPPAPSTSGSAKPSGTSGFAQPPVDVDPGGPVAAYGAPPPPMPPPAPPPKKPK